MKRFRHLKSRRCGVAVLASTALLATPALANADSIAPINFEPPPPLGYSTGNIDGQHGWMKTGPYDSAVATVGSFPAASGYGFGTQALRMSNGFADGAFGGQTFSPGLGSPAGESVPNRHFEASFKIGTTQALHQPGLRLSVSPDGGDGSRMSFLRFEDQPDGVHVFFDDVTNAGPLPTPSVFNERDIATLSRARAHRVKFSLDLKPGPANDVVRISIDGRVKRLGDRCITGGTWENYYRFDPEQAGSGNVVPAVSKLLFHARGTSNLPSLNNGFLVDDVSLLSSRWPTGNSECKDDKGKHKGKHKGNDKGKHKGKHRGNDKGKHHGTTNPGGQKVAPRYRTKLRTRLHAPRRVHRGEVVRTKVTTINTTGHSAFGTNVRVKIPNGLVVAGRTKGVTVKGRYASWNVGALGPKRTLTRTLKMVAGSEGKCTIVASSDARNATRSGSKKVVQVMGPRAHSQS